ncbi:MAG: phosphoesterase [Bacteroidetes bacterium HGW-Bacteroidetes-1]|jgi:calcineurin-like phosphoesterase family protein|nr:MAG: phosphoesterase [Bacteroidetes bacterium HGW-Bacteroidetes-1]
MKRFFISDTHFNDEDIIKYENRPFIDAENMEIVLVHNWNKTVRERDQIFVLGDFVRGLPVHKIKELLAKLKGRKYLIIGNHDNQTISDYLRLGFELVSKYPIIVDDFYICSHAPIYLNDHMPYANIHGHIHSKQMVGGNYFNASVEQINYTPINFDEIKKALRK